MFDSKEKRGGNFSRDQLLPFVEDLIKLWDLIDFKPKKGLYTWTNNRTGVSHISAHLDRFLVQSSFLLDKKLVSSKILPKLTSNHKPILLQLDEEENLGPVPFCFSPQWIEQDGFLVVVAKVWSTSVIGSPSYVWEQKLKATKLALKEWVKSPSNSPTALRKVVVQQLVYL